MEGEWGIVNELILFRDLVHYPITNTLNCCHVALHVTLSARQFERQGSHNQGKAGIIFFLDNQGICPVLEPTHAICTMGSYASLSWLWTTEICILYILEKLVYGYFEICILLYEICILVYWLSWILYIPKARCFQKKFSPLLQQVFAASSIYHSECVY